MLAVVKFKNKNLPFDEMRIVEISKDKNEIGLFNEHNQLVKIDKSEFTIIDTITDVELMKMLTNVKLERPDSIVDYVDNKSLMSLEINNTQRQHLEDMRKIVFHLLK